MTIVRMLLRTLCPLYEIHQKKLLTGLSTEYNYTVLQLVCLSQWFSTRAGKPRRLEICGGVFVFYSDCVGIFAYCVHNILLEHVFLYIDCLLCIPTYPRLNYLWISFRTVKGALQNTGYKINRGVWFVLELCDHIPLFGLAAR